MQMSRNTVMRKIEIMSENVTHQPHQDFDNCSCFSLQLDKSTDIKDEAQIIVFIRMIFEDIYNYQRSAWHNNPKRKD